VTDASRPPGPGWVGHDQGGPPFPADDVPRPKWSRRRRAYTLLALLVVVVAVVGAVAILTRPKHEQSAADFVADYLHALSHGSAADVLSYGDLPDDRRFLTDAALRAQQQRAAITDVTTEDAGSDTVHATYRYGTQPVDAKLDVVGSPGHWKLATTTVQVQFVNTPDTATLFGVSLRGVVQSRVFPGPLVFGSASNLLTVQDNEPFNGAPDDTDYHLVRVTLAVTPAGTAAARTAVQTALAECATVQDLAPDTCPQRTFPNLSPDENLVRESIHWTAPTDLTHLTFTLDGDNLEVVGPVYFGVRYDVESTAGGTQTRTERVLADLNGTVDLSASPPKYVS
jgi:hypothetical protein